MKAIWLLSLYLVAWGCVPNRQTSINNDTACNSIGCIVSSLIESGKVMPSDIEIPLMLGGQAPNLRGIKGITVGLSDGDKYYLLKLDTDVYDLNKLYIMLKERSVEILAYHIKC